MAQVIAAQPTQLGVTISFPKAAEAGELLAESRKTVVCWYFGVTIKANWW